METAEFVQLLYFRGHGDRKNFLIFFLVFFKDSAALVAYGSGLSGEARTPMGAHYSQRDK
jgi:hypothetical protein